MHLLDSFELVATVSATTVSAAVIRLCLSASRANVRAIAFWACNVFSGGKTSHKLILLMRLQKASLVKTKR